MGEKKIHQVLSFEIELGAQKPSLPTIHHLAAKALIKDWQTPCSRRSKKEIMKLSIEGSVISSHTAFIAIDEESSGRISGAMKIYDIQAADLSAKLQHLTAYSACISAEIDQQSRMLDRMSPHRSQHRSHKSSAGKAKPKGGILSGLFGSKKKSRKAESQVLANPPPGAAAVPITTSEDFEEKDRKKDTNSYEIAENEDKPSYATVATAAPTTFSDTLTALINAQQANGSWVFNPSLAQHLGKPLKELEDACPKDVMSVVWATVLVLTLLKKKFSGQHDEWELIAMKAESWLKKQSLPSGMSEKSLFDAANRLTL